MELFETLNKNLKPRILNLDAKKYAIDVAHIIYNDIPLEGLFEEEVYYDKDLTLLEYPHKGTVTTGYKGLNLILEYDISLCGDMLTKMDINAIFLDDDLNEYTPLYNISIFGRVFVKEVLTLDFV